MVKELGIFRSKEWSWRFQGPLVFPAARSRQLSQPDDLGPDDLEGTIRLFWTQVRQRDGPRHQVRGLQTEGVPRLRHEYRLEIEQAEVEGIEVPIFERAKSIIDCFRNRDKFRLNDT